MDRDPVSPTDADLRIRYSLRFKLSVGLILIIGSLFAGLNAFNLVSSRRARRAEALSNMETIARLIAGSMLGELGSSELESESVKTVVRNFLRAALDLNKKNKDFAYAVVVNPQNEVVVGRAKTELTLFPGGKTIDNETEALKEIARLGGKLDSNMQARRFPLQVNGQIVGKLIVGISLTRLEHEIAREVFINLVAFCVVLSILVIYSTITLRSWVTRPIKDIAHAMLAVQRGDYDQQVQTHHHDEIGLLAHSYNFMVHGIKEQERLKDAFNRYVSKQVYEHFQAGAITLSGEARPATILFSDIRSFTTLSEQLTPAQIVAMLNEYFDAMVEVIFKYDGFLNKFIGDALMAIYNVPLDQAQHELRAVKTALEMRDALTRLNQKRQARGEFPIRNGIGVNTGPVVAGNIGHLRRLEYTVIGDAVNLASRIESQTKVAGASILISQFTYDPIAAWVDAEPLPPVKVKGKADPVRLYALQGIKESAPDIN
ncbi:MAG: adenylate/guanylate cyclase domain-containing protein [Myxococcota bacterium]